MRILSNSKDLLDNCNSRSLSKISSILALYFSTLDTTVPSEDLKTSLKEIINNAIYFKNRQQRYMFMVLGKEEKGKS